MKQVNKVKWYRTTEKRPNYDCRVVLLNYFECFGIIRRIYELEYSKTFDALNCNSKSDEYRMELTDFEYWCYAEDFYKQFERAGFYAENPLRLNIF